MVPRSLFVWPWLIVLLMSSDSSAFSNRISSYTPSSDREQQQHQPLALQAQAQDHQHYHHVAKVCEPLIRRLATKLDRDDGHQTWIGVAGGPGSGKTTIANHVAKRLNWLKPDSTIVIPMDGWHIPKEELIREQGADAMLRRGAPWTFDAELCAEQLSKAKESGSASLPVYDRKISDPVPDGVTLSPSHKIVLVEGIYVLHQKDPKWGKVYEIFDERWFITCRERDEQRERLIRRSLRTWHDEKVKLWGPGREGAAKRVDYNDVKNMDLVAYCEELADEVIVTK